MRYNLKNRPKPSLGEIKGIVLASGYFKEVKEWFEGFEQELRERLKMTPEGPESFFALIKEMLGEA